jgi:hypothetical protein
VEHGPGGWKDEKDGQWKYGILTRVTRVKRRPIGES